MGGDISVTSEEGKGSVFTFQVEIKEGIVDVVEAPPSRRVAFIDKDESGDQEGYRILVVDDKDENLKVAVNFLKLVGFETNEAVNGEDAIHKFTEWNPNLILMDMRMPVMDGIEATRRIKLTEKGKNTPIVALTASTFEEEQKKTQSLDIQGYIRKPFRENELFHTIGQILGIKYIYKDEPHSSHTKYFNDEEVMSVDIAKFPESLIVQMQEAIASADFDLLIEFINQIGSKNSDLARQLLIHANKFDYNYLQRVLMNKETK
jgi:CheY-like chemotaxis protein